MKRLTLDRVLTVILVTAALASLASVSGSLRRQWEQTSPAAIAVPTGLIKAERKAIVLAISPSCQHCTDSAVSFQAIQDAAAAHKSTEFLIAVPEVHGGTAAEFLRSLGLSPSHLWLADLRRLGIRAVPSVLLVDSDGTVVRSWLGVADVSAIRQAIAHN